MPRGPEFFRQLSEQLLEQLEEHARQPGRTGDQVHEWLAERGVTTSRSSVYRWFQDFRLEDRTRRASEVAAGYLRVAEESDPQAVTQASLRKFNELVFDALVQGDGELSTGDLMKLSIALKTGLGAQQIVNELRRVGREEMAKLQGEAKRRAITPEDIERVSKAVFG